MRSGSALPTRMSASGPLRIFCPNLQPVGLNDVALLAVGITQQRDARRTAGIVFDRDHRRRNPVLVALEVDQAQLAFVAAAAEPHGRVARIAASAGGILPSISGLCGFVDVMSSVVQVVR